MNFEFKKSTQIPKLAWCLTKEKEDQSIKVLHGEWVEVSDSFFIEGAWDGVFSEGGFDLVESLMGSGCLVKDDKLIVCPPSNTTECVYSLKKNNKIWFSNSLTFILTASESTLDYNYLDYENDILSISDGLSKYKKTIPLNGGSDLHIHFYNNLEIGNDFEIVEIPKKVPRKFKSYEDYKQYLDQVLKNISDNSTDPNRVKQYKPIVFCSNGYDSVACAVLGKDIGCDEAVVFESKRGIRSDSGKPIVECLEYGTIHEKYELDYKKENLVHEFVASGELGTSIYFSAAEDELCGKMLLSGIHGDKMWDKSTEPDKDLKRSFYPDLSKKDFRLRVGFINVVIPFIGVKRQPEIVDISNSPDMKGWSIGNNYDRPVARRIAEEKGVPRELFGIYKSGGTASSLRFLNLNYLEKIMPKESFIDFENFYRLTKSRRKKSVKWLYRSAIYLMYCGVVFLRQRKISLPHKILKVDKWDRKFKCSPWAPSFLFLWGNQKLVKIYSNEVEFLK